MLNFDFLQYPEFIVVAVLALALVASGFKNNQVSADGPDADRGSGNSESTGSFYGLPLPGPINHASLEVFNLLPVGYRRWVASMLVFANHRTNAAAGEFASVKTLFASASLLLAFFAPLFVVPLVAALLYFIPDALLAIKVHKRQKEIRMALPQALDLMVLCVDAGLGLDATMQRVANDQSGLSGVLNQELNTLSRDILLGMERQRAYSELYNRTGVDELKMLGSALHQSTKMGLSIARILRSQSEFLRARHAQKVEERAAKLPVWISFPLWFCIMPALLFVIIGPSLITFMLHIGHVKPDWFN